MEEKRRERELGLGLKRRGPKGREGELERRRGATVEEPTGKNDFHSSESSMAIAQSL